MKRVKYRRLVETLEQVYKGKSKALRASSSRMMICAYVYLVFVLVVAISVVLTSVFMIIKFPGAASLKIGLFLIIFFGPICYSILRGIFVKLPPPEGTELTKDNAPKLFDMLDSIVEKEQATKIHKVILTGEFNAAAVQLPRLGVLGWAHNYLIIGLPLMQHLTADEFKSVVAHEFGHLSNRDGSSGNWIYRMRVTWEQIINHLISTESNGGIAIKPFINWFWPRFNARAFVLSREQEYLADTMAAEYTSSEITADALKRIHAAGPVYEGEVYEKVLARVNTDPEAPENFYAETRKEMLSEVYKNKQLENQNEALKVHTNQSNTHPSLTDRLNALEIINHKKPPAPVTESAAEYYLQESKDEFERILAKDMFALINSSWVERHKEIKKLQIKLEELSNPKNKEEFFEQARIFTEINGIEEGMNLYKDLLKRYPNSSEVKYIIGSNLTDKKDPSGIPLLYDVLMKEPNASEEVFGSLFNYYESTGNIEKFEELENEADKFEERFEASMKERNNITKVKDLSAAELTEKERLSVKQAAAKQKYVKDVYVAKRGVKYFPEYPSHLLAVKIKFPPLKYASDDAKLEILEQMIHDIVIETGDYYLVVDEKKHKKTCKKIRHCEDLIYSSKDD